MPVPCPLAGKWFIDSPAICKHFNLGDPLKMNMPMVMSLAQDPTKTDVYGGRFNTKQPTVTQGGATKPFSQKECRKELMQLGFTKEVKQLQDRANQGKPPDGASKKGPGGAMIYPRPHFV